MRKGYIDSFNGMVRDELMNESLFLGLDHVQGTISDWGQAAPPHGLDFRLATRTRWPQAAALAAYGSSAAHHDCFVPSQVAHTTPTGVKMKIFGSGRGT
jgi:putative transposase